MKIHLNESTLAKRYKIGQPIFEELFKLKSDEIKEKIKDILKNKISDFTILEKGRVTKEIRDDIPYKIVIDFYDVFDITWMGIYYRKEFEYIECLVEFNEHFKL